MTKKIYKRRWLAMGKTKAVNMAGFTHLLPLYREAINKINETENEKKLIQLAAREGESESVFIDRMNNDAVYRTEILNKYKIG